MSRKDVEVRIENRTLWVDSDAYPLAHVTRVRPLELRPRRGRILVAYGRQTGAFLGLALAGLLVIGCLGRSVPPAVGIGYQIAVVAVLLLTTVRLIRRLGVGTLYALQIRTASSDSRAVVSRDRELVHDLATRVIRAIDDPGFAYTIHVDHIDIRGDLVGGDKYGGDTFTGDKYTMGA